MSKNEEKNPRSIKNSKIIQMLDEILEMELSGVARYLHYSFMIVGPNRIPIVKFFRDQANESLSHAVIVGEKISALGGHPSVKVKPTPESHKHSTIEILKESLEFEVAGLQMYERMLPFTEGNVALEELIREFIRTEQEHVEEVEKMLLPQNV